MKQEEALQIIKQVIDAAVKAGLFHNIESVTNVGVAYQTILENKK
jgi:hypothetical protein